MSSLSNLKMGADVKADDGDSLGGFILESGIYPMKIDMAYMGVSQGGATSLNMVFKHGQQTLKQTFWVASGDAKGNKTTFTDKNSGEERPLPGMSMANAITFLTIGKELGDLDTETKTVNIYDFDAKAEIPTQVEVIMDLLGKDIVLGVQKRIVDKNIKNDNGNYVPSGDTRQENEVAKVFQADTGMTVAEVKAGETAGTFMPKWGDKWIGQTIDKSTGAAKGGAPTPGAPAPAPASGSLFPTGN